LLRETTGTFKRGFALMPELASTEYKSDLLTNAPHCSNVNSAECIKTNIVPF